MGGALAPDRADSDRGAVLKTLINARKTRFRIGDPVFVQTNPEASQHAGIIEWDRPPTQALVDCYLVRFENDTAQWMPAATLHPRATADTIFPEAP